MTVDCEISLEYEDEARAEIILRSIEQDNTPFACARRESNRLIVNASGKTIRSMIHTLEDLLVCIKVAEGVLETSY